MTTDQTYQTLLIVEDSDIDFEATHRALKRGGLINPIHRCLDGDEALDYLFQTGRFTPTQAPRPGLVLLDLNLPGTDGREVLRQAKQNELTKTIPIVVLTTSGYDQDVENCYLHGANSYLQKPVEINTLFDMVQRLKDYWFGITLLPKNDNRS